jgi:hypothetical protein
MSDGVKRSRIQSDDGEATMKEHAHGGLVLVVSDGMESASVSLSPEQLRKLVAQWVSTDASAALLRAERAEAHAATMLGRATQLTTRLRLAEAVVEAARDVSLADESPDHTDAQREDRHALLHVALCAYDAATKEGA